MLFVYETLSMNFEVLDGEGIPILFLHGWGCSGSIWNNNIEILKLAKRKAIVIDFFGFGLSSKPRENFGVFDYANSIIALLQFLGINKVDIVAHSFGGRVAIILASNTNLINKMLLSGCAGLRPKRSMKRYVKVKIYKIKKKFGFDTSKYGSSDYRDADQTMKKVLTKVVNQHLDKYLKDIKCPVVLFWGKFDDSTPIYMAKKMNKKIRDCSIIEEDGGHFMFLQKSYKFNQILLNFLGDDV